MDKLFFSNNRKKLSEIMEDGSIIVLFAGSAPRKSANEMYPFIPNIHFYYLTGLEEDEIILMMKKVNGCYDETLFIKPYDELRAKWDGATITLENAQQISGIQKVMYRDDFKNMLNHLLATDTVHTMYFDLMKLGTSESLSYTHKKAQEYRILHPHISIKNIHGTLLKQRNIKQQEEIACMKKALDITNEGIGFLMKYATPGMYEYQLEAYFDFIAKTNGITDYGFKTIAAAGENATILHYQKNNSLIPKDSLILFDLGIKYKHYGVDISRTFPVNGRFTDRQKLFYNIVLKAQQRVIDAVKPGLRFGRLNEIVREVYLEELGKLGMVQNDQDINRYYFHGVSHFLSSDAMTVNSPDTLLEEGMVFTVEPGLYIKEEKIGIRIEDDVLVTKDGCEVLSKDIIKRVEDIETFMRNR